MTAREFSLLAAGMSGGQLILLGLTVLVTTVLLRRAVVLGRRARSRDPLGEVRRNVLEAEQTSAARLTKLEVRLHDYGREVDGRMEARIAMLHQLVHEANGAIQQLERLLEQIPESTPKEHREISGSSPSQRRDDARSAEAA